MGRSANWPPKIRQEAATGADYIRIKISGRDYYQTLGPHDSEESRANYLRIVAELEAAGRQVPLPSRLDLTVVELLVAYEKHARVWHAKSRSFEKQMHRVHQALGIVRKFYGRTLAHEFGPRQLKAVRLAMARDMDCPWCDGKGTRLKKPPPSRLADRPRSEPRKVICRGCQGACKRGWSRNYINACMGIIRNVFMWANQEDILPRENYQRLADVPDLRPHEDLRGPNEEIVPVRQGKGKVKKPPRGAVEQTLPYLHAPLQAIRKLMALTGMRADEATQLRPADINTEGIDPEGTKWDGVWIFTPEHHKTMTGHGDVEIGKAIVLGARCQEILRPYMDRDPQEWCFQPREAMAAWRRAQRQARKSRVQPSQKNRAKKRPKKAAGAKYSTHVIAQAVARAARRAGVEHWHPHQLRHEAGTVVRAEMTLDHSRAVLGHQHVDMTLVYAEADLRKAVEVARRMG